MEAWVAVLEQIAKTTNAVLERMDRRFDAIEVAQRAGFRWLLGTMLGMFGTIIAGFSGLFALMAHGFHWL